MARSESIYLKVYKKTLESGTTEYNVSIHGTAKKTSGGISTFRELVSYCTDSTSTAGLNSVVTNTFITVTSQPQYYERNRYLLNRPKSSDLGELLYSGSVSRESDTSLNWVVEYQYGNDGKARKDSITHSGAVTLNCVRQILFKTFPFER